MITQEYLQDRFVEDDGFLFYKYACGNRKAGACAGWWDGLYYRIRIDGVTYLMHRIIWLYRYGEWPSAEIDHINGDGSDNRIDNLRKATSSENSCNANYLVGESGSRGVHRNTKGGPSWRAAIQVGGRQIGLGFFETIDEAEAAYKMAAEEHHGKFAFHNRNQQPEVI